jgi:hypothetical protein
MSLTGISGLACFKEENDQIFVAFCDLGVGIPITLPQSLEKNKVLLGSRAYTPEQVKVIAEHQNDRNALATQLFICWF